MKNNIIDSVGIKEIPEKESLFLMTGFILAYVAERTSQFQRKRISDY